MHDWSKVISTGVGPIIVISACGVLCLAFYNRMAAVVTRLRSFHRERLHEQEALQQAMHASPPDEVAIVRHQELLGMLETQTTHVNRRARLIRLTLASLLLTIACLASCSLALGLSTFLSGLLYIAAALFILGLVLLVVAVVFAMVELRHALDPVDLESRFVQKMVEMMENA